jgi:transposase
MLGDVAARLVITAVVVEGRSQAEVAPAYGVSPGWVSKLLARYRAEGERAFAPRTRRPRSSPSAIGAETVELIPRVRKQLTEQGQTPDHTPSAGTCTTITGSRSRPQRSAVT